MKKRGWIGVLFVICCLALLTACGSDQTEKAQAAKETNDVKKASAYPEADAVAKVAYEAILDGDKKGIFNLGSKDLQKSLLLENSPDPDFYSETIETINSSEVANPNNYKNAISTGDYFLGVYDNLKNKNRLNYLLILNPVDRLPDFQDWYTYTENKEYQAIKIELIKEDGQWKLEQNRDWFSIKGSERNQLVQNVVDVQNEKVTVLHRGTTFQKK
ncbi:hypothetical protein HB847_15750 [Listeria booriae]|uniref:Lipoprotein n=1 Tax=Listeria booriae TaxID=1552123 RepID=A0A841YA48_9LIST|nr:hypothetical protein [Listeria booriae]MBC1373806.1 hypothetical protein [Listeria booriae]